MTGRKDDSRGPAWRLAGLAVAMTLALCLLGRRLYGLQIEESGAYSSSQLRQSVRRVLIPATRGRIFDRDGVCLADNRPSYCIALFIEDLRRPGDWSNTVNAVDAKIDELSLALGISRQIGRREIASHIHSRLPMPLLAWQDIDERTLALFSEMVTPNSGMDVYVQPERVYPGGAAFAHLIGRVGREKPEAPDGETPHYDILGMRGRDGIELSRNSHLSGKAGGKLITVNVSGFRHSDTNRPSIPGRDLRLTVASRLQNAAFAALGGRRGAVVALDPRCGDVLALCSSPSFDPAKMTPRIPADLWKSLVSDPGSPLLNRAIGGLYPPGSTFKPVVALAALRHGVPASFTVDCNGVYELGGMRLKCAASYGHGPGIDLRHAIAVSCNPYFCTLGVKIGVDAIDDFAREAGLGAKTGISLPGESAGLVPDDAWKRRTRNQGWRQGDTANLAIGQGFLLATPLQMASVAALIANGGTLYRPRISLDEPVSATRVLELPGRHLDVVRGGMFDVVNGKRAGGRRARVRGISVAAKTGTAEYGPRRNRRKHTWMIAFAPFENPEIAIAAVIEDGESGGLTAAPVVASVLREYFGVEEAPDEESEDSGLSEYEEQNAPEDAETQETTETQEGAGTTSGTTETQENTEGAGGRAPLETGGEP
ncbi:MAG: penicillin-binding protein 2 [Kiritimatiellae bacterium]|nr:penicillin-binding protein 2 [Kiritimatiellia bacterium]